MKTMVNKLLGYLRLWKTDDISQGQFTETKHFPWLLCNGFYYAEALGGAGQGQEVFNF